MKKINSLRAKISLALLLLSGSTFMISMEKERSDAREQEENEQIQLAILLSQEDDATLPPTDDESWKEKEAKPRNQEAEDHLFAQQLEQEHAIREALQAEQAQKKVYDVDNEKGKEKEPLHNQETVDQYDNNPVLDWRENITPESIEEYINAEIKRLTAENKKITARNYRGDNADDVLEANRDRLIAINEEKGTFTRLKANYNKCRNLITQLDQIRKLGSNLVKIEHRATYERLLGLAREEFPDLNDIKAEIEDDTDFRMIVGFIQFVINRLYAKSEELDAEIRHLPYLPTFAVSDDLLFHEDLQKFLSPDPIYLPPEVILARQNNQLQMRVLQQNAQHGGSGSCGYHTVKNCSAITRLLLGTRDQQPQLLHELSSESLINITFGQNEGIWRSRVICKSRRQKIKNFIADFLNYLPKIEMDEFGERKKLLFTNVARILADQCAITVQQTGSCFISGKNILRAFKTEIARTDGHRAGIKRIIKLYIPHIKDVKFKITAFGIRETGYSKNAVNAPDGYALVFNERDQRIECDWLDSDEMDDFIHYEQEFGLLKNLDHIPFIKIGENGLNYDDRSLSDSIFTTGGIPEADAQLADAKALFFNTAQLRRLVSALLRGNPDDDVYLNQKVMEILTDDDRDDDISAEAAQEELGRCYRDLKFIKVALLVRDQKNVSFMCPIALHLPGHWISFVINKVGNQTQYIIADSVGSNRLNEDRVKELISYLEGRQPAVDSFCIVS